MRKQEIAVHHNADIQINTVCIYCDNAVFNFDEPVLVTDDDGTLGVAHEECHVEAVNPNDRDEDEED